MITNLSQSALRDAAASCAHKITSSVSGETFFDHPFKHLVIDDFLPRELAELCDQSFPPLTDPTWHHSADADIEVKSRTTWQSEFDIPDGIAPTIRVLNSAPILSAMGQRFGIPKLIPDPYFTGGGLNVSQRGGLLDVHVDGNYHDATGLNRRMNLLVYFCREWEESWGGEFGIFESDGKTLAKKVAPLFNRCVIFDSHDFSFHGLPDPIQFPAGSLRKSVILYYYTKEPRPQNQIAVQKPHSALWVKKGLRDKHGKLIRDFS